MTENKIFIKFDNVSYSYNAEVNENRNKTEYAVKGINLDVEQGCFMAIIGQNGSGKSTIARLMNGLILPLEGTIMVNSIATSDEGLIWEVRKNVGMVFQNPDNQIIGTSVEEDIAFGPENLGIERNEMISRINDAMHIVGIYELRESAPHLLSGGQKQRVAIAGILAMKPQCIVLDEATAMLDPIGRCEVLNVIEKLNRENNITIIHITHHMDEVIKADRVLLVSNGKIIADATPKEIFSNVKLIKDAGLEAPQVSELFSELIFEGIDLPKNIITIKEAVNELKKLLEVKNVIKN